MDEPQSKIVRIDFLEISANDRKEYKNPNTLAGRKKVVITDEAGHAGYCFMEDAEIEQFGKEYILQHVSLSYLPPLKEWFVVFDRDEYYNDLKRNPLRPIRVEFVEVERWTGREIYRGIIDRRYYFREAHAREKVAIWTSSTKKIHSDNLREAKPNSVFICGEQKEPVSYRDGKVAAWEDTFNPEFHNSATKGGL